MLLCAFGQRHLGYLWARGTILDLVTSHSSNGSKIFHLPVFSFYVTWMNDIRMCLKWQFQCFQAITFFWSHISPLLTALSTRWNDSGGEIWGIFNRGSSKKAEAICLQTAELVDGESRRNGELILSVLLLLAKPSMEKETSNYNGWKSLLAPPSKPLALAPCLPGKLWL